MWSALVSDYSSLQFTQVSDRLIALAGLVREIHNITGEDYLAGLWREDILHQLNWFVYPGIGGNVTKIVPTYMAPSWSWLNVYGPVTVDLRYNDKSSRCLDCSEVLDVTVESDDGLGLHSLVSSRLELRGLAFQAKVSFRGKIGAASEMDSYMLKTKDIRMGGCSSKRSIEASIHWDENLFHSEPNPNKWPIFLAEKNCEFLFLLMSAGNLDGASVEGLVLKKTTPAPDGNLYIRRGAFHHEGFLFDLLVERRGLESPDQWTAYQQSIDLDDDALSDLVQRVMVV